MFQLNFTEINHEIILFILFNVIVIFMLILDLGILTKKEGPISLKKAGYWTLIWVGVSMLFAVFIYFYDTDPNDPSKNRVKTMEFLAGYLLEYSLSIDNLFVFIMIFQKFRIGPAYQPEILKWGIIGAVVLRAIMILLGASLVAKFGWVLYVFGFFLIYTAYKMFTHKEEDESFHPENNMIYKLVKKVFHISHHDHHAHKFFIKENGKLMVTPLFVVLCLIETSDVMFALDSIPAVFSITQDPFIVYTSNIFAILGLRSLYFMI
ncbi:MAG: TerC/Alx family metal homeostasis membrane protein, partial [Leptospiraceae bacterium]|nr:TerC/Alx family metal homeostasis membrane protein [Leptospiraceae bacterium]